MVASDPLTVPNDYTHSGRVIYKAVSPVSPAFIV